MKNVILFYSDHPRVSATNVPAFRVVRTRIKIKLLLVYITSHLRILYFWVKIICLNTVISISTYITLRTIFHTTTFIF